MESNITKQLDDHESRIRRLEENDIKQQMKLTEIQKSQAEIKSLVLETDKEQSKNLNDYMNRILQTLTDTVSTKNKLKLIDRKEFWAVIAAIITAIVTYFARSC